MADRIIHLPETIVRGRRLGRHVHHDERSRVFVAPMAPKVTSVLHPFHGAVMDQGNLGSCTAHALFDALKTDPLYRVGRYLTEKLCREVYSRETHIDPFPGAWPPTDTGSDGISACKVGVERGWLQGYTHTFSPTDCLRALVLQPVMIGINWYEGFDRPDPKTGLVRVSGRIRGGHEVALIGIDDAAQQVIAVNSWGSSWGVNGRFRFSYAGATSGDLGRLLSEQGDCTVPTVA